MRDRFEYCKVVALAVTLMLSSPIPAADDSGQKGRYTEAMYQNALENSSTSPDFILVTIRDGASGVFSRRCVEAPFLLGAIHTEHGIDYDKEGCSRALRIALSYYEEPITLKSGKALKNVSPRYTPEELTTARKSLEAANEGELRSYDFINELCGGAAPKLNRDAVALVLLENGVRCVRGCVVGDLSPRDPNSAAQDGKQSGEQGVAPQSATRPESDSRGGDKPRPESESRPR